MGQIKKDKIREESYEAGKKSGLKEAYDASPEGRKKVELKTIENLCGKGELMLAVEKDGKLVPISWEEVFASGWDCVNAKDPKLAYSLLRKLTLDYKSGDCLMVFTKDNPDEAVCAHCDLHIT
jgi:hypothetical protein